MTGYGVLQVTVESPGWNEAVISFEVRDSRTYEVTARGISGRSIDLPAARYLVTAIMPDGSQLESNELISVEPGQTASCTLAAGDDTGLSDEPIVMSEESDSDMETADLGLEAAPPARRKKIALDTIPMSIVSVNLLESAYGSAAGLASFGLDLDLDLGVEFDFDSDPTNTIRVYQQSRDQVLVAGIGPEKRYLVVPVEFDGYTAARVTSRADEPWALDWSFSKPRVNSFYRYIHSGLALESRVMSREFVALAEEAVMHKSADPLAAVLGCYVLLRANELEGMDQWTINLRRFFPWMADNVAVRVEYLARMGQHKEAAGELLSLQDGQRCPSFRSGIGYLSERALLYAKNADTLSLGVKQRGQMERLAAALERITISLDMRFITTAVTPDFFKRPIHAA